MIRSVLCSLVLALGLQSGLSAGDFAESVSPTGNVLTFTGAVGRGDSDQLRDYLSRQNGGDFRFRIETPGGLAGEGVAMCDMLRSYAGSVTTEAFGDGAWSAGAMMWVAGTTTVIDTDSVVGFHLAYIPGCETCDTSGINAVIGGVLTRAMLRQPSDWNAVIQLLFDMAHARQAFGPQGFVMFAADGSKNVGRWWDFYPTADETLDGDFNNVGRVRPADTSESCPDPDAPRGGSIGRGGSEVLENLEPR